MAGSSLLSPPAPTSSRSGFPDPRGFAPRTPLHTLTRCRSFAFTRCLLLLRHRQAGDRRVGVVREADAVDAIEGLQLARRDEVGLVEGRDDGAVDRAVDLVALHRHRNLLRDRL